MTKYSHICGLPLSIVEVPGFIVKENCLSLRDGLLYPVPIFVLEFVWLGTVCVLYIYYEELCIAVHSCSSVS